MKYFILSAIVATMFYAGGCSNKYNTENNTQKQLDSLKTQIAKMKPGLGEYMLSVQIHHSKLWFAGVKANWPLAKFEIDEIREQLAHATEVETDRVEIKSLPMIFPFLDSIDHSIAAKDEVGFKNHFTLLTNTCNTCHANNHFEFIKIKTPETPFFTNQD